MVFGCCWWSCNHREAGTRIIRYSIQSDNSIPVAVVASDTNILSLFIYAIGRLLLGNIPYRVQMKIDDKKFVDVNDICSNLSEKVRKVLLAYHSITGSDTTSYPFGVEKVKPFKKALKKDKIGLLQCFKSKRIKKWRLSKNLFTQSCVLENE